jgi:hypothetical protein
LKLQTESIDIQPIVNVTITAIEKKAKTATLKGRTGSP